MVDQNQPAVPECGNGPRGGKFTAPLGCIAQALEATERFKVPLPRSLLPPLQIITACKGVAAATLCPTASLWLSARGISQAYCGVGEQGWGYLLLSFPVLWVVSDFYEFYYHRLGHMCVGYCPYALDSPPHLPYYY